MIIERKIQLEKYLNFILNDPFLRGYKDVKKFVALFKNTEHKIKRLS